MLVIIPERLRAIQAHGEAAYPNEGAGLLLGRAGEAAGEVLDVLPADNTWAPDEQSHRYLISPQAMLQAEAQAARRGLDVLGAFHSHPDHPAVPSEWDRDWAWPNFAYVITSVISGQAAETRAWQLAADRSRFDETPITAGRPAAEPANPKE